MITQEQLKKLLHYNPETGIFTRVVSVYGSKVGSVVGCLDKTTGYLRIGIEGGLYYSHRLAWMYVHGEFPLNHTDHKNGIKTDNRMVNIRSVTHKENLRNQKMRSTNKSGVNGVSWSKRDKKWHSAIMVNGKQISLHYSSDFFEAVCARFSADKKYGFHINHGQRV